MMWCTVCFRSHGKLEEIFEDFSAGHDDPLVEKIHDHTMNAVGFV